MSALFNQTNLSPGTSFAAGGGGGGSNFPNGIAVGSKNLGIAQGNVGSADVVYVSDASGVNCGFLAGQTWAGDIGTSYINTTSTAITCLTGDLTKTSQLASCDVSKMGFPNWTLSNVAQVAGSKSTTLSNDSYTPLNFTIRPDQAVKGGTVQAILQYDAVDTGANYATVVGANNTFGFIGSVWPGYISMPFQIFGATVQIDSDNETFLFMDGKAGALGTISTGTPFLSSSNAFSSIITPAGDQANMSALFSTLKANFPDCFDP